MNIYFDDFLVCCPALLTNHDTNLQYPPIMTVPLHPLLLLQIHDSKYKIQNWIFVFSNFTRYFTIAHKQWPQFQSSKLGRSREGSGKCWRKTALKCTCKCGKNSKCRSNLLLSRLFWACERAVSNWSQFAHKTSATRYCCAAKAWVANPFPIYPLFS